VPRAQRTHDPSGFHHITAHGVDDRPIFLDDFDRQTFLQRVERVVRRHQWTVHAACLMTNHFHLVLSFVDPTLAEGMHVINGAHARQFNARHGRRGPVFEARYSDTHIETQGHLLETIRYIALNPVRAGLARRPEDWPWSTYGQLVGLRRPWPFFNPFSVLALFDERWEHAVKIVREFVEEPEVPGTERARHKETPQVPGTLGARHPSVI
jgi:REP element-mobilizing transposase RayT